MIPQSSSATPSSIPPVSADQEQKEYLFKLLGASNFLEQQNNLEQGLQYLAKKTAQILNAEKCSIMLLQDSSQAQKEDTSSNYYLRVFTHYGGLPQEAYQQVTKLNDGIAGYVAAKGEPLLIEDITKSEFIGVARNINDSNKSLISAPVWLADKVIGVINVSNRQDNYSFSGEDLKLLEIFALFIGKSIQIFELQNILKSRFIELAVAKEMQGKEESIRDNITPDPAKLSKIVAKAIFRELDNGGFGANQIISITTEILNILQQKMSKEEKEG